MVSGVLWLGRQKRDCPHSLPDTIPEDLIVSRAAKIQRRKATTGGSRPGAGRPTTLVPCPRCGQMVTPTKAKRGHGCQ